MNERLEEMENKLLQATNEDDEDVVYASICAEAVLEDLQWTVGYAKKQAERVEELERELERIKVKYRVTKESHYNCSKSTSELEQQNERYREALEFYANQSNWMNIEVPTMMDGEPEMVTREPLIFDDGGRKAREALEGEGE